jgi:hypothetical protein
MNKKIFIFLICLVQNCSSRGESELKHDQTNSLANNSVAEYNSQDTIEVIAYGDSIVEADSEAKRMLIEKGIGLIIESGSSTYSGQLQYSFISSYTKGFISNYARITEEKVSNNGYRIKAKGQVSLSALGNALEERKKEIGNPKMMILMNEIMFGKKNKPGSTKTEYLFQSELKKNGFDFIDEGMMKKLLAREKGLTVGSYENPRTEELALKVAAELNTDILVIADSRIRNGGQVQSGVGVYSIQSDMKYKMVNVGTANIISSANETAIYADIDQDLGATGALKKNVIKISENLKEQISKEWQAGSTTRIIFKGISIADFLQSGITDTISKVRGVNGIDDRGNSVSGIVIEVKCFCSTGSLMKGIIQRNWELDYALDPKEIKGNLVIIDIKNK